MSAVEKLAAKWERQAETGEIEGMDERLGKYEREVCEVVAFRLRTAMAEDADVLAQVEQLRIGLIREGGRRDAFDVAAQLTAILYPNGLPDLPVPRTPYERMDFERAWDERVKKAQGG